MDSTSLVWKMSAVAASDRVFSITVVKFCAEPWAVVCDSPLCVCAGDQFSTT